MVRDDLNHLQMPHLRARAGGTQVRAKGDGRGDAGERLETQRAFVAMWVQHRFGWNFPEPLPSCSRHGRCQKEHTPVAYARVFKKRGRGYQMTIAECWGGGVS